MALTLVQGPRQLLAVAPCIAPLLLFSDLMEIKTAMPEIETNRDCTTGNRDCPAGNQDCVRV